MLRLFRDCFGLLPWDGLGVLAEGEKTVARARRTRFGTASGEGTPVPQYCSGVSLTSNSTLFFRSRIRGALITHGACTFYILCTITVTVAVVQQHQ